MNLDAQTILTTITLAVSGWTLVRVMKLSEDVAVLKARNDKKDK